VADDEVLRRLYQRGTGTSHDGADPASPASPASSANHVVGRDGCCTPDDLLLLVRRDGDEKKRLAILDHVMTCADCRRELDLLRAVDSAASQLETPRSALRITQHGRLRTYATLLAAAVVLVAVGLTVRSMRMGSAARDLAGANGSVTRGSAAQDASPIIRLIAPGADARVSGSVTLVWSAAPVAANERRGYHVEVLDSAGAPVLVRDDVLDTTLVVPGQLLRADADYTWWVSTDVSGGKLRSPLLRFRAKR
jgi:hypothetical protein